MTADTTVKSSAAKQNFGTQSTLTVSSAEHALVGFDRSAVTKALGSRLVRSARLELSMPSGSTYNGVQALVLPRPWTELGATWNCSKDTDATATGESCHVIDRWNMVRRDLTWDNPWKRIPRGGGGIAGTHSSGVVSFDITEDLQDQLGPEGANGSLAWIFLPTGTASTSFLSRESGTAARLIIEPIAITDFDGGTDQTAPLSFTVDSVPHGISALPGFSGGPDRPVAATQAPDGTVAQFLENEIIIHSDDATLLSTVKARLNATEISTSKGSIPGLPKVHLLTVDTSKGDPATLAPNLLSRAGGLRGRQLVSSDASLRLLAIVADEAVRGTPVQINWVTTSAGLSAHALATQTLTDGPAQSAAQFITSSANNYDWPYFGPGMHEINDAWEKIFVSGDTKNRVKVKILDKGFSSPMVDLSHTHTGCASASCENFFEPNDAPWHGTHVANSGFAEPGNGYGVAGPGWPVSDVTLAWTLPDWYTQVLTLIDDILGGYDIANYSTVIGVPYWAVAADAGGAMVGSDLFTSAARAAGTLIFAAAGNDGKNVDEMECFSVVEPISEVVAGIFGGDGIEIVEVCPFEETWWFPCENWGVNCVGATNHNNRSRWNDPNIGESNFGESIVYTAAGVVLASADPGNTTGAGNDNGTGSVSGTSFATPIVSGIAALTWAANPDLSAGEVEDCLSSSTGTDFVNASLAVSCADDAPANGYNPFIQIVAPADGSVFSGVGIGVNLRAETFDFEDGQSGLNITWSSDVEGVLGSTFSGQDFLYNTSTPGVKIITATVEDADQNLRSDTITISFEPTPPTVGIKMPISDGDEFIQDLPIDLWAVVTNRIVQSCGITWDAFDLHSSIWTNRPGCRLQETFGTPGLYVLRANYADAFGLGFADRHISVINDGKPHVKITSPLGLLVEGTSQLKATLDESTAVQLSATAVPLSSQFTYTWILNLDGFPTDDVLGTNQNEVWNTPEVTASCETIDGTLTVSAQDQLGEIDTDTIAVSVEDSCPVK